MREKEPSIDLEESRQFLDMLDASAEQFTFQTFDDDKSRNDKSLVRVINATFDEACEQIINLNKRGAAIHVTLNKTDLEGRKIGNIIEIREFWIEDDHGNVPENLPITPHMIVQSSPGKRHLHFRVADVPLDEFEQIQQRMVDDYGSDPKAKDRSRVLRLPGFLHQKSEPFMVKIIASELRAPTPYEDFIKAFPPVEKQKQPSNVAEKTFTTNQHDIAEIERAILYVSPDDYEIWIHVGMALHHSNTAEGFELWCRWSEQSEKYDPHEMLDKWESFSRG